jgi:hypothetical protein
MLKQILALNQTFELDTSSFDYISQLNVSGKVLKLFPDSINLSKLVFNDMQHTWNIALHDVKV